MRATLTVVLAVAASACASKPPFVPPGRHDDKNATPLDRAWRACDDALAKGRVDPRHTPLPTDEEATTAIIEVGPDPSPSPDEKLALLALRGHYSRFRDCYLPALRAMPTLAASVTIDVRFEADGSVRADRMHVSGEAPAAMLACLRRDVATLHTAGVPSDGVSVSYPLVFCGDATER